MTCKSILSCLCCHPSYFFLFTKSTFNQFSSLSNHKSWVVIFVVLNSYIFISISLNIFLISFERNISEMLDIKCFTIQWWNFGWHFGGFSFERLQIALLADILLKCVTFSKIYIIIRNNTWDRAHRQQTHSRQQINGTVVQHTTATYCCRMVRQMKNDEKCVPFRYIL